MMVNSAECSLSELANIGIATATVKINAQKFCLLSLVLALFVVGSLAGVHALDHLQPKHQHAHAHAHGASHGSWLNQQLHGEDDEDAEHCGLWLTSVLAGVGINTVVSLHVTTQRFAPELRFETSFAAPARLRPPSRAPPAIS